MVNRDELPSCDEVRDELAELSLGILTGEARAQVLAHLEGCDRCTAELARLSAVADRLALDGPEAEPPAGFESRVLEQIRTEPRRRHAGFSRRRIGIAAAAAAVLLAAAFFVGRQTVSTGTSGTVVHAVGPTTESNLRVAELTSAGSSRGDVYAYDSGDPWLLMTVQGLPVGSEVYCQVTTTSGKTVDLGSFWLTSGSGSWASRLPVAVGALRSAQLTTAGGTVLAQARFSL